MFGKNISPLLVEAIKIWMKNPQSYDMCPVLQKISSHEEYCTFQKIFKQITEFKSGYIISQSLQSTSRFQIISESSLSKTVEHFDVIGDMEKRIYNRKSLEGISEYFKHFDSPVRIVLDIDDTSHKKLISDLETLDHIFNQWAQQQNKIYKNSGLVYRNDNKTRARKYTNIALSISQIINLLRDFESIDAGIYNRCKL